MKTTSREATNAQHLEYLRKRSGIEHARYVRDRMGWRWAPGVVMWTLRHSVAVRAALVFVLMAGLVGVDPTALPELLR